MKRVKRYGLVLLVAVVVTGVWAVKDDFGLGRNMEIMVNMMRELSLQYVDDVEPDKLMSDGAQGMVRNLDPYTQYMSEEDMDILRIFSSVVLHISSMLRLNTVSAVLRILLKAVFEVTIFPVAETTA